MALLSRSTGRKIFATAVVSVGFVFVYEATIRDSHEAAQQAESRQTDTPMPGMKLTFQATAYCKGKTTASGVNVRSGIAAADPKLLPVGSVVSVTVGAESKYNGIYTIMDTGPAVKGRILDVYMWSCHEALAFGRRKIQVTVLRRGWNPRASTTALAETPRQ